MPDRPDLIIYRSSDPAIIAQWDEMVTTYKEQADKRRAALKEIDPTHDRGAYVDSWTNKWAAIEHTGADIPDGFRLNRKPRNLVPLLKTSAGKRWAALMRECSPPPRPVFPGMPAHAGLFASPGMQRHGDWLYLLWSSEPSPVDPALWDRMKLSDWYLMLESEDDESEADG